MQRKKKQKHSNQNDTKQIFQHLIETFYFLVFAKDEEKIRLFVVVWQPLLSKLATNIHFCYSVAT